MDSYVNFLHTNTVLEGMSPTPYLIPTIFEAVLGFLYVFGIFYDFLKYNMDENVHTHEAWP